MAGKKNVGFIDKIFRIIISLALIGFGYIQLTQVGDMFSGYGFIVFGVVFLFIALVGYCPLYSLVGINTHSDKE